MEQFPVNEDRTLVFLVRDGVVHLGLKNDKSFGGGKWNAYGGKQEANETLRECAARETYDETGGVVVDPSELVEVARIDFRFPDHPAWDQRVIAYMTDRWSGDFRPTEEMVEHRAFQLDSLPSNMWVADTRWWPPALRGEYVEATVTFVGKGEGVRSVEFIRPAGYSPNVAASR